MSDWTNLIAENQASGVYVSRDTGGAYRIQTGTPGKLKTWYPLSANEVIVRLTEMAKNQKENS